MLSNCDGGLACHGVTLLLYRRQAPTGKTNEKKEEKKSKYLAWTTSLPTLSRIEGTADAEIKSPPPSPKSCVAVRAQLYMFAICLEFYLFNSDTISVSLILFQDKVSCHKQ